MDTGPLTWGKGSGLIGGSFWYVCLSHFVFKRKNGRTFWKRKWIENTCTKNFLNISMKLSSQQNYSTAVCSSIEIKSNFSSIVWKIMINFPPHMRINCLQAWIGVRLKFLINRLEWDSFSCEETWQSACNKCVTRTNWVLVFAHTCLTFTKHKIQHLNLYWYMSILYS